MRKEKAVMHIGNRILFFSFFLVVLTACTTKPKQIGHDDATPLPKNEAAKYALYAMMSSNAYLNTKRTYFPIEELGWIRVDLDGKPTDKNSYSPKTLFGRLLSNLQFDIWEHQESNKTVISFKGTDEKIDWIVSNSWIGPSVPYKSAKKHVKEYIEKNPKRTVVATGHSLGGGLALSVSLWLGIDAYAFNSSPRVYDGWGDHNEPATRKAIYQENEVLSKVRSFWPKFFEVMDERDIFQTNFDYKGVSDHRADYLAEGLLRCSSNDQELVELGKRISPVKVECNL
jgi:hypothetical protein